MRMRQKRERRGSTKSWKKEDCYLPSLRINSDVSLINTICILTSLFISWCTLCPQNVHTSLPQGFENWSPPLQNFHLFSQCIIFVKHLSCEICYCSVMNHVKEWMGRRTKMDPNPFEVPVTCGEGIDNFRNHSMLLQTNHFLKWTFFQNSLL